MINIRIAHISDIHISTGLRFQDIENTLNWTADRIIAEKCDLCLCCGDFFKDAKVMLDRASQEIASIVRFLRKITGAGIEVIVISGTPSHDSISAYELIKEMQIPLTEIYTKPIVSDSIACLPGLSRSSLLTQDEYKGLPPEQVHRIMTDKITMLCQGMAAQMPDDKPKILMAHMTYQGADTGFTDLLMQNEPILSREAIAGFDLVCLGHIHRPQMIDGNVFYSGPLERLSFNEEDIEPGFWIYDIESVGYWDAKFIKTPARRYVTLSLNQTDIEHALATDFATELFIKGYDIKDSIVRLHYSCSEEIAKQLNRKQLEQALYNAGCFHITEIKADIARADRARDTTVSESLSPVQALAKWCINQGIAESEITELSAMTEELLEV